MAVYSEACPSGTLDALCITCFYLIYIPIHILLELHLNICGTYRATSVPHIAVLVIVFVLLFVFVLVFVLAAQLTSEA